VKAETAPAPIAAPVAKPLTITFDVNEGLSPEQVRLVVADRILRVLALTRKKEPKKALARLVELNAVFNDNAVVLKQYDAALKRFIRFGRFYLTNPTKIKRKALTFLGMHAEPILRSLFVSLERYLNEYRQAQQAAAEEATLEDQIEETPEQTAEHQKFTKIGTGLEALRNVMPRVIELQEARKTKKAEQSAKRINAKPASKAPVEGSNVARAEAVANSFDDAISSDDAYVLDLSGKTKMRELDSTQSAVIRAAVVLTHTYVSEIARRHVAVDFGMQRVLGSYLMMSEALVIGIARYDEFGDQRSDDEVKAHARRLLSLRNASRLRNGESALEILYALPSSKIRPKKSDKPVLGAVKTVGHVWFLLFDKALIDDGHVTCQRWEFYRRPGTADVNLVNN
jgi:hypothetical protein